MVIDNALELKIRQLYNQNKTELKPNHLKLFIKKSLPYSQILINKFREFKINLMNKLDHSLYLKKSEIILKYNVCKHQSLLARKLGSSNPDLQINKVKNLELAVNKINNIVIKPGKSFSFWNLVGNPNKSNGYVEGMLLSNGQIIEGTGGGLCQLSNLLYWLFLHTDLSIVEQFHHGYDVFPDSGRVLPFGSGATIMYNTVDLKVINNTNITYQICLNLTDKHLKGIIKSDLATDYSYHIYQKHHCIVDIEGEYFRFNELWREKIVNNITTEELITTNFAPILYDVNEEYINKNQFNLLRLE